MNVCMCGSVFHVNAGDSIQKDIYRWYAAYHCDKCGNSIEIDGCDIDSIPDDIKSLIIKEGGEWGLESLAGKVKTKYLVNKVLNDKNIDFSENIFFIGTENQGKWVKDKLVARGIMENELTLKRL